MDSRVIEHAKILVEWSTEVKPGDQVVIKATPDAHELVVALYKEIAKAGGRVVTLMQSEEALRAFYDGASDETLQVIPEHLRAITEKCDVYIALRSPVNTRALSNVDSNITISHNAIHFIDIPDATGIFYLPDTTSDGTTKITNNFI